MKNLKFKSIMLLCFAMFFSLLTGCAGTGLSEDFDEDQVKKATEDVIGMINSNDSEAILEISTVQMKQALTEEVLSEVYEGIGEGGEFREIEEISIGGNKDKTSEEEFAVAVAKAKYENKKFTYTITFTKQMRLAGLFYK